MPLREQTQQGSASSKRTSASLRGFWPRVLAPSLPQGRRTSKIVEAALHAGDSVVATARKPEQLADLVQQYGSRIQPLALDVADNANVLAAVKAGHAAFGRYDVVVNNAGYGETAAVEDITIEAFRAQLDTNFYGVVYVSKAVLPILRAQGQGHIFQVSSVGGRIGSVGLAAYQSAKWAVGGFSVVLAQGIAPLGLQVTVIEPGGMQTDWGGSSMTIPPISAPYKQTVGTFAQLLKAYIGQEASDPAKVAGVILQLANQPGSLVRLLLGADAVQYASQTAAAPAESDAHWHDLSVSVAR